MVHKAHQRIIDQRNAERAKMDEVDKLIERCHLMVACRNAEYKTFEYYIIQYCILAKIDLRAFWNVLIEKGVSLNVDSAREAYNLLKDFSLETVLRQLKASE